MTAARARPFRLQPPVVLEHPIQKQVTDMLRIEIAPPGKVSRLGVCWYAIDHAAYSGEVPGIRIGRGIVAGIPDLFILWRGLSHMIELKTTEGELSDPQRSVCAAVLGSGGKVGVARDSLEVLICIDEWKIPRAHRVRLAA